MVSSQLYSLECERHFIGGLLKNPQIFPDVDNFIQNDDFVNELHRVIFSIIKDSLIKNERFDNVIIAQKVKNLNINFEDDIDVFSYIESLFDTQITSKATIDAAKELMSLRMRREMCKMFRTANDFVKNNGNLPMDEIIAGSDKIYHSKINSYSLINEPEDLFETVKSLMLKVAQNPKDEVGLITPFREFNRLYGGIRKGNGVYSIVSRPKHGKSSMLLNMASGCALLNKGLKVLILDTEMSKDTSQYRIAASFTQIPMWYFETGNWAKNLELTEKFNKYINKLDDYVGKVQYLRVVNKPIQQICSIIRRWYYKNVGRGNPALVIYDYIKLAGEKLSNYWAEYQAVGDKINQINEIGANLDIQIFVAMQMNRSAEKKVDDSSAVSTTDRLQCFCAFNGIFRRKRPDEITEDGLEFGTHKLIELATRFQGKDAMGYNNLINVSLEKKKFDFQQNFINYNIENFNIEERGTLRDIINKKREKYDVSNGTVVDDAKL